MIAPHIPHDEAERVAALHALLMLDTAQEDRFDLIVEYCRTRFNVPMALVSLVDTDRQWFKAAAGLGVAQTPRDISFCGHAILSPEILVVPNTARDERFADNPLVIGTPHIAFYAGCPLELASGYRVGTLCLIDRRVRSLSDDDLRDLRDLARVVALELEADTSEKRGEACESCNALMRRLGAAAVPLQAAAAR
jgi:GAF domain-containing protein